MPVHDDLGIRMKENYENISKTKLLRRTPVALRIDGKAFHTFTRGFEKPFDEILVKSMQDTMKYLCENIQGCVFGYTQSDEITLILIDYKKLNSCAWFDYEVQKVCSIAASMATMAFNKVFTLHANDYIQNCATSHEMFGTCGKGTKEWKLCGVYYEAMKKGAMFDCRCFNIPKEEVCNLIYWRQLDATRNSIQMVGQTFFSHNELKCKTCNDIQDMLHEQHNINWNDYPIYLKRGSACFYTQVEHIDGTLHNEWYIDKEMPILKNEDREYVEKWIIQ